MKAYQASSTPSDIVVGEQRAECLHFGGVPNTEQYSGILDRRTVHVINDSAHAAGINEGPALGLCCYVEPSRHRVLNCIDIARG